MPVNAQFPPCYFGMWSGPSYAGGQILSTSDDPIGTLFVQLIDQQNGTKAVSFLDAAARQHDIAYELASRLYPAGPDPKKEPAELKAAKLRADLDLMKNATKGVSIDFVLT